MQDFLAARSVEGVDLVAIGCQQVLEFIGGCEDLHLCAEVPIRALYPEVDGEEEAEDHQSLSNEDVGVEGVCRGTVGGDQ